LELVLGCDDRNSLVSPLNLLGVVVLGLCVDSRVGVLRDLDRLVGLALVAAKLVVKGECEEAARLADEIVRVAERVAVGLRSLSAST